MNIRKATINDANGIATVHVESWKTTYQGIVPSSYLAQLRVSEREQNWRRGLQQQKHHIFVAEEDGKVCGFISGGSNRATKGKEADYEGEIYAIYLLKEAQGKGYGTKLLEALVRDFRSDGICSMVVWVLADNPSRQFYERLGGKKIAEEVINIGGKELNEWCYGWRSIECLA
ncbi:GNAT family N-acetyltransferase [Thermaerobacillus caldiproteolyticus]|uniref:Ribosomal protein S18 acetylase RimI-like enzyme n=1 Tax=Thermaerobacillus caldiproteolyticus TaxID=247480 RepID=A0A7V9Z565_9BACL|nr:GNAT family N-acetyltransferase [Anoxybacillus caldiproteolyticus]MBA2874248.1 ribosomal protein S18 acetylase RimI-like enzyme [Anoxybacillus caldiproteolyticus]